MARTNHIRMGVRTAVAVFLLAPSAWAQFATTGTATVNLTLAAEADITITTATTNLTSSGTEFSNYTGTTSFTYKIRTTTVGGSGSITFKITTDFAPSGGPSVASPPTAGDTLRYTCSVSSPATQCAGSVTATTTTETSVATFSQDAHSAAAGNSGSVGWTLTNDPRYKTGTFTAVGTFTITAL